jgi:predicted HTH domain antitoxin
MRLQSSDTSPEAEKVLISLIQSKSIQERMSRLESLSALTIRLSKRGIARANPGKSKQELDLIFIKLHYGKSLYNKLKKYLLRSSYAEK